MLGALGGALGLYTGFCWVTAFEILELIILMGIAAWGYNLTKVGEKEEPTENQDVQETWKVREPLNTVSNDLGWSRSRLQAFVK